MAKRRATGRPGSTGKRARSKGTRSKGATARRGRRGARRSRGSDPTLLIAGGVGGSLLLVLLVIVAMRGSGTPPPKVAAKEETPAAKPTQAATPDRPKRGAAPEPKPAPAPRPIPGVRRPREPEPAEMDKEEAVDKLAGALADKMIAGGESLKAKAEAGTLTEAELRGALKSDNLFDIMGLMAGLEARGGEAVPMLIIAVKEGKLVQTKALAIRALMQLGPAAQPALPALREVEQTATDPKLKQAAQMGIARIGG